MQVGLGELHACLWSGEPVLIRIAQLLPAG